MGGIGVINNPHARRNRRNSALMGQLGYILGERGDLQTPNDLDALAVVIERFRDREIDVLCINGGDGTIHTTLTAVVHAYGDQPYPRIAILRGGTMNTIAKAMGIHGRPADILKYVVDAYHADRPMALTRRSLLRVDDDKYGFLFGNGIFAQYLELYYEGNWEPSPAKAAAVLGRGMLSALIGGPYIRRMARRWKGTVTVDQHRWTTDDWVTIAAGTVPEVGLGFSPFYKSATHPGHLHVIGVSSNIVRVVRELWNVWWARPFRYPENVDGVGKTVVIEGVEDDVPFMLDGDFHRSRTSTLTVSVGPTLDFIVPE